MTKIQKLFAVVMTVVLIAGSSINKQARADEGMWLPFLLNRLNYQDLQKMGLQLTAEEIYSVNNSSLKDAIVQFGNGCTGEIISSQGLILTNHHCGYGNIQEHSTVEHDYLKDGFWAMKMEEELPNPGLTVSFLVRIEDVTKAVLKGIDDKTSAADRSKMIGEKIKDLVAKAIDGTHYEAKILPFFNGNEYYMFVMEKFEDVRLVGAPPSSIGKYGGDTDNWMWPRHTGDFSMFRVYTDKDGKPAKYSKDNIPMKPKHHLPVSLKGVKKNDYAMVMGYPGSTERYITSYAIQNKLTHEFPTRIKIRRTKLDMMKMGMDAEDKVRIQYASKYARTANYWKNFIGMTKALNKLNVVEDKQKLEKDLNTWINQFQSRKEKYGTVLKDIKEAYTEVDKYTLSRYYFIEGIYLGPEVLNFSRNFNHLAKMLQAENKDQEAIDKEIAALRKEAKKFYKDFDLATEKRIFENMMKMYFSEVPADQMSEEVLKLKKKYCCKWNKMTETYYKKSMFSSLEKVNAFLDKPSDKVLKDPMVQLMQMFFNDYFMNMGKYSEANAKLDKANRLFVDALRKMKKNEFLYPDANFTMRMSYGKVLDYYPQDAVHFNYFTTMEGIMEKEDPNNPEFVVPDRLKEIYENKEYGQYADADGTMKVCFLSDNDITGGNSGSPVINGKGELIGLAFDGNWEAMSGDILFDPELQRTINVDIRYVLMIIDKYAGATNLIEEMTLVK